MNEIRIKNSMRKVWANQSYTSCGETLMQLPRIYKAYNFINGKRYDSDVCSFRSLICNNKRWTLDLPYYCYAYNHSYRVLPLKLSRKIDYIVLCQKIINMYKIVIGCSKCISVIRIRCFKHSMLLEILLW